MNMKYVMFFMGVFPSIFPPIMPAASKPVIHTTSTRTMMVFEPRPPRNHMVYINPDIYRTAKQRDRINRRKRCCCIWLVAGCTAGIGTGVGLLVKHFS